MTSHLDDGIIQELLDGEIPSSELGPLQAHLASCSTCRVRLDAARTMAAESEELLELLDEPVTPAAAAVVASLPEVPHRSWGRTLAWAASVALAVGAGWYARGDVQQVLPAPAAAAPEGAGTSAVMQPPTAPPVISKQLTQPASPRAAAPQPAAKPAVLAEAAKAARADEPDRRERSAPAAEAIAPGVTALPPQVNAAAPRRDLARPAAIPTTVGGGLDVRRATDRVVVGANGSLNGFAARDQLTTRPLIAPSVSSDTLAIRIAAVRTLLESMGPSLPADVAVICVAFSESQGVGESPVEVRGGRDLPDSVLTLLAPAPRPVRASSACIMAEIAPMPTVEEKTGRPAVMLLVGGVRMSGAGKATVGLQHRFHGRGAGGHRCDLERRNGVWVVVKCTGTWVA